MNVDLESFQLAIQQFKDNHKDIVKISEIYISEEESFDGKKEGSYSDNESRVSLAISILTKSNNEDIIVLSNERIVIYHDGVEVLTPQPAIDFLKSSNLIIDVDGETEALPALRKVWDSVKDLDVGAISAVLSRKAKEEIRQSEGKVTIVGISLPSSLMTIFGPTVLKKKSTF